MLRSIEQQLTNHVDTLQRFSDELDGLVTDLTGAATPLGGRLSDTACTDLPVPPVALPAGSLNRLQCHLDRLAGLETDIASHLNNINDLLGTNQKEAIEL